MTFAICLNEATGPFEHVAKGTRLHDENDTHPVACRILIDAFEAVG